MDTASEQPPRLRKFKVVPSPSVSGHGPERQATERQATIIVPRERSRSRERLLEIVEDEDKLARDRGARRRPREVYAEELAGSDVEPRRERRRHEKVYLTSGKPRITVAGRPRRRSVSDLGRKGEERKDEDGKDDDGKDVKGDQNAQNKKSTESIDEGSTSSSDSELPASDTETNEAQRIESERRQRALLEFDALYMERLKRKLEQAQVDEQRKGTDTFAQEGDEKKVEDPPVTDVASPDQDTAGQESGIFRTPSRKTTWNEKIIKRSKPNPPSEDVVDPFGGLRSPDPMQKRLSPFAPVEVDAALRSNGKPAVLVEKQVQEDITKRPTCSLNLVCYSRGCSMVQIRVATRMRHANEEAFEKARKEIMGLITTDEMLFKALRKAYWSDMCGFWRRWFSLKTLRRLRLLSYVNNDRPQPVPWDDYTMQEVLAAFNDPSEFGSDTDWIDWVFSLRQNDKRHMLEFVEGWNAARIAILGSIPCLASTLVGVVWSVRGGDVQTAFTVAGFILTVATVLLALLAVISGIDSKSY